MQLQTIRPNIVQAIRAYRVDDLMRAAQEAGQHFLYANLAEAQNKQEVLDAIAASFMFPAHFGKNLDALYDCITDSVNKSGAQTGFVVVLELIPDNAKFDREFREQLLDTFREAADFWAERRVAFRCFYSFAVAPNQDDAWEHTIEVAQTKPISKASAKAGLNPNFGVNMPLMSSAFDTSMWLSAA